MAIASVRRRCLPVRRTVSPFTTPSASIVSSIEFDNEKRVFATAGVSKRIQFFDFRDVCCSVTSGGDGDGRALATHAISTRSKLSCLSYNAFITGRVASSDYEGVVAVWDAETRAAYDETIDGLPRFARPRYGSKSVFDKERLKIGPVAVLAGCFLATVTFITLNQRANQVSDKASITRSEYYQRWLKRARKVAKEDRYKARAPGSSAAENDDAYFERFLEEERIVFLSLIHISEPTRPY